jgi:hypothetical protein
MAGPAAATAPAAPPQDAELDRLCEALEQQLLASRGLVGRHGALLSDFCHQQLLLEVEPGLRQAALLALSQLMAVDGPFCEANVNLLFTLLQNRWVGGAGRGPLAGLLLSSGCCRWGGGAGALARRPGLQRLGASLLGAPSRARCCMPCLSPARLRRAKPPASPAAARLQVP